jgi:transcription initiation factor IIE alpha subunit
LLYGNQLEVALFNCGLIKKKRKNKRQKHKSFRCHKCDSDMIFIDNTNVMVCSNDQCKQYFLFEN